jgi:hypothetical protein
VGRWSSWIFGLLVALGCAGIPATAQARQATAGIGLSEGAASLGCTLYALKGCPVANVSHALFDRYQALASDQTDGVNSFQYARAGVPWDAVSTGGTTIGSACTSEAPPPAYYGAQWIALAENYVVAARRAGVDPLIAITTNTAAHYSGSGNANDPANPTANQYLCGFRGIVSTLNAFAARNQVAPPTEYEIYDEPDGAQVSNACNPTPRGDLPPHSAEQCAGWYYYEADVANRTIFGDKLTLVALSADGDSANDPNLISIGSYARYLTGTIGVYPSVWSFHPYEDVTAAGDPALGGSAHSDTSRVSGYIASLYPSTRSQPRIWLTEAAAQITDPVPTYFGTPEGCPDGEADDPAPYSLGGCLDGNPRAQAYAASDFLTLPRAGSAFPGQITRVYWHQFDSAAGQPTGWDSGLVAPGDRYVRASYCVLAGESVARALADPMCNRTIAADDSEDTARGPEERGGRAADSMADPCPQPWCAFSLLRLRLTRLGR